MKTARWSRRRYIAETLGCDIAEVEEHQRGSTKFPLFQYEGRIVAVFLPSDRVEDRLSALGEREMKGLDARMPNNAGTSNFRRPPTVFVETSRP